MPNFTADGFMAPDDDPLMPAGQRQRMEDTPAPSRSEAILKRIEKLQGSRFGVGFLDRNADKEVHELQQMYGQVAQQESHQANQSRFDREFKSREQDRIDDRQIRADAVQQRRDAAQDAVEQRRDAAGQRRGAARAAARPMVVGGKTGMYYNDPETGALHQEGINETLEAQGPTQPGQAPPTGSRFTPATPYEKPQQEREFAPKTPQMFVGNDGSPYSWTPGASAARPITVPGGGGLNRPGAAPKAGAVTGEQTAEANAIKGEIAILKDRIKADPELEPELRLEILQKQRALRQAIGAYDNKPAPAPAAPKPAGNVAPVGTVIRMADGSTKTKTANGWE